MLITSTLCRISAWGCFLYSNLDKVNHKDMQSSKMPKIKNIIEEFIEVPINYFLVKNCFFLAIPRIFFSTKKYFYIFAY